MRAWYCMLGCLLCVGLAPPARGEVIVNLDQQITDTPLTGWSPLLPYTSWITATFNATLDNKGVELSLQTHLNPGEFVSEIVMAVHIDSSGGLKFSQKATTGQFPDPTEPYDPTVAKIQYDPENIAIQGGGGGSPQGTGYDVRLSWPTSNQGGNNPDRYGAVYNNSQVRFLITWNDEDFLASSFLETLAQQSNDPNNGDPGLYVMAAHIQGIAPLTPGGEQRSSFIGALDPPPDGSAPEPGTWALGGLGMLGLVWQQVRRQRRGQPV